MRFEILGPLRVVGDDGHEVTLPGSRQAELLALLLLRAGRVVSSDRLIDEIWGEQPPANAAKAVQVNVSRLRRALGDGHELVATRNGGYVLEVDASRIDAARFEGLVSEGCSALAEGKHPRAAARLREALALWRGEPLSNLAYASFAQAEIARLEGLRLVALESAIEAELALGRHAESIPELDALVARYPVSERLRAQLMLALYRSGRQADALEAYRAARRVLVGQLGIEPGAELRELERAILAQDAALSVPAAAARHTRRGDTSPAGLFVGYERELGLLEDALERTLAGHGALALVAGEPGIGKTRLVEELASVARARGAEVHTGRCWAESGAPAYWSWIQLLRGIARERDPAALRMQLGRGGPELAQLLPELRDALPDLPPADVADPEEARFRLFDATAEFLREAARRQPLVLIFDDLHEADEPTLTLLRFAAGRLSDAQILVLGAYRDTGIAKGDPLRETLAQLGRAADCARVSLTGLTPEATAHFVELSAGVAPLPRLAAAIHDASSGNPLFVSELVRLLSADGRLAELSDSGGLALPGGLDDVIVRRLHRLSGGCRATLALAALIGREFETALLEAASGGDPSDDLAEALDARLVERAPEDSRQMRFSHELVRQSLATELPAKRRRALHATIGAAVESRHALELDAHLSQLAHQYAAAWPDCDAVKAIDYLERAADQAAEMFAQEEAVRLYERAIEIARDAGAPGAELNVKAAEQLVLGGHVERTSAALAAAAAEMGQAPDPSLLARVDLVRVELDLFGPCEAGREPLESAVALFREIDDPFAEARAWRALFLYDFGRGRPEAAAVAGREMLACAKRAGSRSLTSSAVKAVAVTTARGKTPVSEALPLVQAMRRDAGDANSEARLLAYTAELEAMRGNFDESRALTAAARSLATGLERDDVICAIDGVETRLEFLEGNLGAAEALARATCDRLEETGLVGYLRSELSSLIDALVGQGRLDEAGATHERAAAILTPDDDDAVHRQARSRARLHLARGEIDEALRASETAAASALTCEMPAEQAETLLVRARVLFAAGREDEARAVAESALAICVAKGHDVLAADARGLLASGSAIGVA